MSWCISHTEGEKKKEKPTTRKRSLFLKNRPSAKTTEEGFSGLKSRAVLREPPAPLQRDTQKWEKMWLLLFFHVRGAEDEVTTDFVLAAWVKCHIGNHSRVWPEGGFISNMISYWTRTRLACKAEKRFLSKFSRLSPEHQPDLEALALENQKQRTAEREAPASSTISSTISICGGKKMHFLKYTSMLHVLRKEKHRVRCAFISFDCTCKCGTLSGGHRAKSAKMKMVATEARTMQPTFSARDT